jgi:hypothetical protein
MNIELTIKKNRWGEWVVRLHHNGRHQKKLDYFASDLDDAKLTAVAMRKEFENREISRFMGNAKIERE